MGEASSLPGRGAEGINSIVLNRGARPDGARVFTATLTSEIERVGARATAWLAAQSDLEITELWVVQSSCRAFHCYSLSVWYRRLA